MKSLFVAIVAMGMAFGALAASSKSWPSNYWATMQSTEANQRPTPATESLELAEADADFVQAAGTVQELDTFLFARFMSANSLTGFSTMPFGFLIIFR